MKDQTYVFKTFQFIIVSLIFPTTLVAQSNEDAARKIVKLTDSTFWAGYNTCNYEIQGSLIAEDIELYHDKGGITLGKAAMMESLKGLCGADFRLRRVGLDSTIRIHLLKAKDTIYGAVISGTHQFYLTPTGKPERLDGQALFDNLWLLKGGQWKLARVFSYDHGPAKYISKRKEIKLPKEVLQRYTGTYIGKQTGKMVVSVDGDHLLLLIGGNPYLIYPESERLYFAKDRDLTFEFSPQTAGKRKLIVREFNALVEEALQQ
ncbi:hypothetical protein PBAL39_13025 [Pedobacter sp. BAL39]|uniref:nuclear transport factor 2 family protein n=1 Tax=Pedobacter sp. BAL39 TaxID=391596 RepID=UPI0001559453|nr:DUF4440 domain-containing protein [Pedobacter sp. BAL39]EDM35393.1 hypothetical protein PBAL39_13025 [Pedobacter sp. BAL39]